MLEGLEINEIYIKELERTLRLDSEFYKKENIDALAGINKFQHVNLNEVVFISDGNHMAISESFIDKGIPYYRGQDTHHFFIENANPICIDNKTFNSPYMLRSHIKRGDVLLSIVGTIGKLSLVYTELGATCSCKLAILRPKKVMSPELISVYLSCYYGQNQIKKFTRGAVQMGLILEDMDQIIIPKFSANFDSKIVNLVENSYSGMKLSTNLYMKAENNLLNSISVNIDTKYSSTVNLKSFQESFLTTGRLDAEYYQPKYDEYLNLLKNYHNGFKKLTDLCELKNDNYLPNDETQYRYIELSNIGNNGEVTGCTVNFGKELPSRAKRIVKEGDVLISSIEGSLSSCALVTKEYDGAICSTGFYVVNSKKINSETLLILFKSELMQNLLKQGCSGTILTAINNDEFKNLLLPVIDDNTQQTIASLIQQSSKLKKQSQQLLEVAKKAVEIAIEQNEATAIDYINSYSELMQEDGNWG